MEKPELPHPIKLRLGRSTISALALVFDPDLHPFVSSARLVYSFWHKLIRSILLQLHFQSFIRRLWPVYFLPDTVILKAYKLEWDDYYRSEQDMYGKLEPLQGHIIPMFYGEALVREDCGTAAARLRETRALVLSEVHGILACDQEHHREKPLEFEDFQRQIREAIAELGRFCVVPGDRKLDNVFLVDGRVMFIDLEMAYEIDDDPERLELAMRISRSEFGRQYASYLLDVWEID